MYKVGLVLVVLGMLMVLSSIYFYENHHNGSPNLSNKVATLLSVANPSEQTEKAFEAPGFYLNEDRAILGLLILPICLNTIGSILVFKSKANETAAPVAGFTTFGIGGIFMAIYYLNSISLWL